MTGAALVTARDLTRVFNLGGDRIQAVHGVSLDVMPGQIVVITGRSGSGKTTLFEPARRSRSPTSGSVLIREQNTRNLNDTQLVELRRRQIGFVFQSFGLMPLLSAYENVELPLRIAGWKRRDREGRAQECLEMVGLGRRSRHGPYEPLGGRAPSVSPSPGQCPTALAWYSLTSRPANWIPPPEPRSLPCSSRLRIKKRWESSVVTHDIAATKIATSTRQMSDGTFVD